MLTITSKLHFEFDIGVFYSMNSGVIDKDGRRKFDKEDLDPSLYKWITELAEHKSDHLQSLRDVEFWEKHKGYCQIFLLQAWDPPLDVDWAFDDAGIDLKILVRAPPGTPPALCWSHQNTGGKIMSDEEMLDKRARKARRGKLPSFATPSSPIRAT
jgi:hypothetical protein